MSNYTYILRPFLVTYGVALIVIGLETKENLKGRYRLIMGVVVILMGLFFPSPIKGGQTKQTTIPSFTTLSNGIYYNVRSYKNIDGKWLSIIHRADVIGGEKEKVTVQRNTHEIPVLISLWYTPSPFLHIGGEGTNKFIRTYLSSTNEVYKLYQE